MNSPLVSVASAASKLKLSPQQVRSLCRSKKIKAVKVGNSWVIDKDVLSKYYSTNNVGNPDDRLIFATHSINNKKKPIVLSFFSGAMGLDNGLEKAGYNIRLCSEIDNSCRKTIQKNKPEVALIGDIREYTTKQIREAAGLSESDEIDLVVGGPPCQAFSTAGKRKGFEDERGDVLLEFLDRILSLKPKYAIIENVRGILSAPLKHRPHEKRGFGYPPLTPDEEKGGALNHILGILKKSGYGVTFNLYNSANFGSPQKRERVIIVCSKDGTKLPYLVPTHSETGMHGLPKWVTFRDVTKHLPRKSHYLNFPEKRLKYYRMLKPGQYWKHLPEKIQKEALGASYFAGGGKTGFLRRLAWNKPSPTLVTHPAMPATDLAHPEKDRPLSVEEYKRIQEFSDTWQIEGSLVEQYKQIGNAVPLSLGHAVGKLLLSHSKNKNIKVYNNFPYSRYKNTDDFNWQKQFNSFQQKSAENQLELTF